MNKTLVVFRRELRSYFATPLAYVFIVIFLVLAAVFTFQMGGLLERGQGRAAHQVGPEPGSPAHEPVGLLAPELLAQLDRDAGRFARD